MSHALILTLYCGLFPVWLLAGLGDYLCHRRTDIEHTSGHRESILHFAQAVELAPALLVALFLRINALTLTIIAICVAVHTATAYWDIRFTTSKRFISAIEQIIHAVLLLFPVFAAVIACVVYWPAASAPDAWHLEWRQPALPPIHLALILGGIAGLNFLPLLEELWRTRGAPRVRRSVKPLPG